MQHSPDWFTESTQYVSKSQVPSFAEIKADPKIHMEMQGAQNSQTTLKKNNKVSTHTS